MDTCTLDELRQFHKHVEGQLFRVNALLVVNTILIVVMVWIGTYGNQYRRRALTRFLFISATTLFLPIMSYVISAIRTASVISLGITKPSLKIISGLCTARNHVNLVLLWTGLVQIIAINRTTVVAIDPREGPNIAPPVVQLVQALWTFYIGVYSMETRYRIPENSHEVGLGAYMNPHNFDEDIRQARMLALLLVFAVMFAKILFKYYAFYEAGRSSALGCNPRFIVGYMEKLQASTSQHAELGDEQIIPPPLIVSGEDKTRGNNDELVTMDNLWQSDDRLMIPREPHKDLCLSFGLFKLLRCRFSRYNIIESDSRNVRNFFWHVLFKGNDDKATVNNDERVIGLISDELSFIHDCYYSTQPISYSKPWLPALSVLISLLSMACCLFVANNRVREDLGIYDQRQMVCYSMCGIATDGSYFGSLIFGRVAVYSLLLVVFLAEASDIIWYICSDWTKITVYCCYLNKVSWKNSPTIRKWVRYLLQYRTKMVKPLVDKMNQCSILVIVQRKTPMALLRRHLRLPEQKKNIKIPTAVKAAILGKLRNSLESVSGGVVSLRRSVNIGNNLVWERSTDNIADTLLVWHIATSIFEVRHPQLPVVSEKNDKDTATHLSNYCAYLVIYSPELLPGDDECCKSLYNAVKKDAERVLAGRKVVSSTPEKEFLQLVDLLDKKSKHEVLKNGAKLANQLSQLSQEEEPWKVLADFWLEMILYVAPSVHLDVQAEAIARGGELITLLWALLNHLGVDSRDETRYTDSAPGSV